MKVSKSGYNVKIKCTEDEYNVIKYCVFDLFDGKDGYMKDWVLNHRIEDDDMEDIAYVMKGAE